MGLRSAVSIVVVASACTAAPPPAATPVSAKPAVPTPKPAPAPAPSPAPAPAPPPGAPVTKLTLAEAGLEATSLDRTVDPCVDFYQFACGGWLTANQIPANRSSWTRFGELGQKTRAAYQKLLEDDARGTVTDPDAKKLGDFYASCLDEAAIEKAGTAAIKPLLDKVAKVKDPKSWFAALAELHKAGIWVVWQTSADADFKDSTINVTQLDTGGLAPRWDTVALGLPDRDYYLDAKHKETLDRYTQHVARMLGLGGIAKPEVAAADVIAIETEIAKLTKTGVEKRDPQASYNPTDLKGLAKQAKSIDWKAYFKTVGFTPSARIVIGTPKFFAALDGLRKKLKPAQWSNYFAYHVLLDRAYALPKEFDDEAFALRTLVTGVAEKDPRPLRCATWTAAALGELLGRQYVDKNFPAASRTVAATLIDAVVKAMNEQLGTLDWMSDATKLVAQDKLAKLARMVGFPDRWRTYDIAIKREDFGGNALRATAAETRRVLARSGKPVDRTEWQMNTFDIDAYYNANANNTAIPAGILQPPFFGADRSVAANMGAIGMVIGHELTHGFDDQGAQFDAKGNLVNWWKPEDKAAFEAKAACLAKQYDTFEAAPKSYVNGKLTLGENIADLGGTKMAFHAYRALRKDAPRQIVADGFTEDQQFFLGMAQIWCGKDRKEEAQRRLVVDNHSPPKFRVYGALRNLPEFAQAFSCAAGTPMRPAETCSVW